MLMKTVLLNFWWVLAIKQCAGQIAITYAPPPNVVVALNRADPLELVFRARAEDIFVEINDILVDSGTLSQLIDRGINIRDVFSNSSSMELSRIVIISNFSIENNNTKITWHAFEDGFVISNCTVITIVGYPTVPYLQLNASNEAILHLTWEEPFSFDSFPIVKYYISVLDINQMALSDVTLNPDTRTFNFTAMGPVTTCTELTFRVIAENRVGNSSAAIVRGAFPSRPGLFTEMPSVTVYFPQDENLVKIAVDFTFPLCPHNNTTYVIVVADADGGDVVYADGPKVLNCSSVHVEITDARLQLYNRDYILNVTVSTTLGSITSTTTFSTTVHTTVLIDPDTTEHTTVPVDSDIVKIAIGSAVGAVAVVVLIVVMLCIIIIIIYHCRKRTKECTNTTRIEQISPTVKKGVPMVVNPVHKEEIPSSHFTQEEESYGKS